MNANQIYSPIFMSFQFCTQIIMATCFCTTKIFSAPSERNLATLSMHEYWNWQTYLYIPEVCVERNNSMFDGSISTENQKCHNIERNVFSHTTWYDDIYANNIINRRKRKNCHIKRIWYRIIYLLISFVYSMFYKISNVCLVCILYLMGRNVWKCTVLDVRLKSDARGLE